MANTLTKNILMIGPRHYVAQFTCISDGTDETALQLVDISTLLNSENLAVTKTAIQEIQWDTRGFDYVQLYWDHTAPDTAKLLSGRGSVSYNDYSYLYDPGSAGGTGDLMLNTSGATAGATYDFTVVLQLR